ncbi:alpha/beta hydrolase [Pseudomonas sp. RIT-PI-S]|uniref:alpha/beta fold hydrolase n=1 Tax=Pseudomonas sp. RIT-PI-S TaxID=3035295 RepID=UPI0021D97445|nr:alpha/beta hydrolase [Pseudomonas sp. RIT-PI-S]
MTADIDELFPGFSALRIDTGEVAFEGVLGGAGPPVLLLHGYPQTHLTWRHIAPVLARQFTVIAPDLPGYGASKTHGSQPRWSKRRVATALAQLMEQLGFTRFSVVGHDRGARAGYRLALDYPGCVERYASLTVAPTLDAWQAVDMAYGLANFHWFFLAQPFDLPERLLAAAPDAFILSTLGRMAGGLHNLEPAVVEAYVKAFRDPNVRHAMCEDYRSAAEEDLDHDAANRAAADQLQCPVLVLWPQSSKSAQTPLDLWRQWAPDVRGKAIAGGHLQPEQSPAEVLEQLLPFLKGSGE